MHYEDVHHDFIAHVHTFVVECSRPFRYLQGCRKAGCDFRFVFEGDFRQHLATKHNPQAPGRQDEADSASGTSAGNRDLSRSRSMARTPARQRTKSVSVSSPPARSGSISSGLSELSLASAPLLRSGGAIKKTTTPRRNQLTTRPEDIIDSRMDAAQYGTRLRDKGNRILGHLIDGDTGTIVTSVALTTVPAAGMYVAVSRSSNHTTRVEIRVPPESLDDRMDLQESGVFRYNATLFTRRDIQFVCFLSLLGPVPADRWYDALATDGSGKAFQLYLADEPMYRYKGHARSRAHRS